MLRNRILSSALLVAMGGTVLAANPAPVAAPEKRVVIRKVDGGARSTAPTAPLSTAERARIEKEMAAARERLQEAAQEVAELSMQLGQRDVYRYEFKTGATPHGPGGSRPLLGVVLDDSGEGVRIRAVTPGGPAEQAGMRAGDTLFSVNGKRLPGDKSGIDSAVAAIGPLKEGQKVAVTVVRGGTQHNLLVSPRLMAAHSMPLWSGDPDFDIDLDMDVDVDVELDGELEGLAPEAMIDLDGLETEIVTQDGGQHRRRIVVRDGGGKAVGAHAPHPRTMVFRSAGLGGLQLAPLNPELGRHFGAQSGVLVLDNKGESFPELRTGDVITRVDGKPVAGHRELMRAMMAREKGSRSTLDVVRDRKPLTVSVATPTLRDVMVAPPAPPLPPAPPAMPAPPAPPKSAGLFGLQAPPAPPAPPTPPAARGFST